MTKEARKMAEIDEITEEGRGARIDKILILENQEFIEMLMRFKSFIN